ncbi:glycosyltransferase family 4 protein [Paraburkholderia strydomiana]|jgi:glycosyltransferase involved in cell wall biosynthesis|uniref:glycosyltransferase family 4 protein n=1 Tax=Paraburkholderia strydomiana TaxID=1245417 RepID=UPI0038B7F63D
MPLTKDWATECRHPSPTVLFALPNAIYFLLKFRSDLASFEHQTVESRITLYFWWKAYGERDYPDFEWVLGEADVAYVAQLDTQTLVDKFPQAVSFWLAGNAPDILDDKALLETLLRSDLEIGPTRARLPRVMTLLIDARADLRANLDLGAFSGQLAALSWWETHGQFEYPRLSWSPNPVWDSLNELGSKHHPTQIDVPAFLELLVNSRPDLRSSMDMTTFAGRLGALIWWDEHGKFEYPRLVWQTSTAILQLNEIEPDERGTLIDIPRFVAPLVSGRPDLRSMIDLSSFKGRFSMLLWWDTHGKREYRRLDWPTAKIFDRLNELDNGDERGLLKTPHFLPLLIESRPDLQALFDLDTYLGRLDVMQWWMGGGKQEYSSLHWPIQETLDDLLRTDSMPAAAIPLPRLLLGIRENRPDLTEAFDITTLQGALGLVAWWYTSGRLEYLQLRHLRLLPTEIRDQAVTQLSDQQPRIQMRPFGVNIVGFPQGVLGLGEDARMAAQAMQLGNIDVALINAPMSGPARIDTSVNHLLRDEPDYQVSLFCLPPPEMVRLALEGGRRMIESDTYRIGAWPWELPHWPSAFGQAHAFVDEIWAQSRFVEAVYAKLGRTKVRHMPMAVVIPTPQSIDRQRYGLPKDDFLFYLMFDGNSWLTRKNPVAGIMAFKQAFAKETSGVGLVIKAMNVRGDDPTWQQVLELAAADERIHIVSERLNRQDTIDFMACCNAYISLHRSEGFGRVIAEAMALGQPVVTTNFSGNVDFCDEQTAFLVDGELVPLRPGDYLFHEGQYWCDPDVGIAAGQIARVFGDANLREGIAQAGRERIERDYSMAAVARAYAQRLNEIRQTVSAR